MLSFEATASLFFCLLLFFMSIDFNFEELGECITHLLDFLMKSINIPLNTVVAGINTGLGIVLGNWVINSFKYKNLLEDISKIFDLVVSNQIDDLYNIQMAFESIKSRLTTHTVTIIGSQNDPNIVVFDSQRTDEERRGLLKDIERIKDRESTIRDDDLYKGKLDDIKFFKSENLDTLVRYFRKLKVALEDIRNFTFYELPNSLEEFDNFNWRSSEISRISKIYEKRINFLIARINIVICLGLMSKHIFKRFDIKVKKIFAKYINYCSNLVKMMEI